MSEDGRGTGYKYDAGKLQAGIIFEDFPLALLEVIKVATMGSIKYKRSSWRTVPNCKERYKDAKFRHIMAEESGEKVDEESGLPHAAHAIWNALAGLQLELEQEKKNAE